MRPQTLLKVRPHVKPRQVNEETKKQHPSIVKRPSVCHPSWNWRNFISRRSALHCVRFGVTYNCDSGDGRNTDGIGRPSDASIESDHLTWAQSSPPSIWLHSVAQPSSENHKFRRVFLIFHRDLLSTPNLFKFIIKIKN